MLITGTRCSVDITDMQPSGGGGGGGGGVVVVVVGTLPLSLTRPWHLHD